MRTTGRPRRELDDGAMYLGVGSLSFGSDAPDHDGRPVGVLVLPDPEQRHGWREFYVWPDRPASKPNARPIGFGRAP